VQYIVDESLRNHVRNVNRVRVYVIEGKKFKKMQKSTLHSASADDMIKVGASVFV